MAYHGHSQRPPWDNCKTHISNASILEGLNEQIQHTAPIEHFAMRSHCRKALLHASALEDAANTAGGSFNG